MKKLLIILAVVLSLTALSLVVSGEETVSGSKITSIKVIDGKLNIEAGISGSYLDGETELGVFAVTNGGLDGLYFPIAKATASEITSFSFDYPVSDPAVLQNGFVVAVHEGIKYKAITPISYIENVSECAVNKGLDIETTESKKGLQVQMISDALTLGVKHSTVSMVMNKLLSDTETEIKIEYGGNTYYVNEDELLALDSRVKTLSESGITVYMEILMRDETTGALTMPSVTDTFVNKYSALCYFISERYSRSDKEYGYCDKYIVGHELNNEKEYNFVGISGLYAYADYVCEWLRQAEVSLSSGCSKAEIYISLSSEWTTGDGELYVFGAREFYDEIIKRLPTLPFGIHLCAYTPSGRFDDEKLLNELDTPYISLKNLSVLTDYTGREVIIEYGTTLEKDEGAKDYLLSYNEAEANDSVTAFIYHRHVDFSAEDGNYGLYTSEHLLEPFKKKEIWNALYYADKSGDEAKAYCENLIGSETLGYKRSVKTAEKADVSKGGVLFDFSSDRQSFYPTDNIDYFGIVNENGGFARAVATHTYAYEYFGITRSFPLRAIDDAENLSVKMRVSGSGEVKYKIRLECGSNTLEYTENRTSSDFKEISFSIADFVKNADSDTVIMKIWASNETGNSGLILDVKNVSYGIKNYSNLLNIAVVLIIIGIAVVILITLTAIAFIPKREKKARTEEIETQTEETQTEKPNDAEEQKPVVVINGIRKYEKRTPRRTLGKKTDKENK